MSKDRDIICINSRELVLEWLKSIGCDSNPFSPDTWDAAHDAAIADYLAANGLTRDIAANTTTLVFADIGGGKSTLREWLARVNRLRPNEDGDPLVVFSPAYDFSKESPFPFDNQDEYSCALEQGLLRNTAFELLGRLALRPDLFLNMELGDRIRVKAFLDQNLPGQLEHFLEQFKDIGIGQTLMGYDPGFIALMEIGRTEEGLDDFYDTLRGTEPDDGEIKTFKEATVLLRALGYKNIQIIFDGLDGHPETVHDAKTAAAVVGTLYREYIEGTEGGVMLKAFLPTAAKTKIEKYVGADFSCQLDEEWQSDALRLMLRYRFVSASGRRDGGINSILEPDISDIENKIVKFVAEHYGVNPREVLVFVDRLLLEHVEESGPTGFINKGDFERTKDWYLKQLQPADR